MEEVTKPKRGRKAKAPITVEPASDPAVVESSAASSTLVLKLHGPGMGPLHRAGLGGLACTLKWIEREVEADRLQPKQLPGGPWAEQPPWEITEDTIALKIGEPDAAREYLQRLFVLAFDIKNDLIYLPGQYPKVPPSQAVRADLQQGLTLTFLQHGRTRKLGALTAITHELDEGDTAAVTIEYKPCSGFKHQELWEELLQKNRMTAKSLDLDGPISPGTAIRHVAFGDSKADQPLELALPIYFGMVGSLALAMNRGVGVLLVPEVADLNVFAHLRPLMTPTGAKACQVTNAADAVLQAQLRLKAHRDLVGLGIPSVSTMTFRPTPWASQQKSRVDTLVVSTEDDPKMLDRFETALAHLPPRIAVRIDKKTQGRGKKAVTTETPIPFRADSVVRPLVAENLARGRPWYSGFLRLMTARDPANNKPIRDKLSFEREGLNAMTKDESLFDQVGEKLLIEAVHEAIRGNFGRIRDETDGGNKKGLSQASKNRMTGFRERLRLDLAGAKTEDQVRFALMDLFSRAKSRNSTLQDRWGEILPIIRNDWKLARDLGLLALVSYKGATREEIPDDSNETETSDE